MGAYFVVEGKGIPIAVDCTERVARSSRIAGAQRLACFEQEREVCLCIFMREDDRVMPVQPRERVLAKMERF